MERRKKYVIFVLCAVAFAGISFGALQFGKTKKTVQVSVTNLNNENFQQEDVVTENKEEIIEQQEPVTNKQDEKAVEPIVQEKIVEKKTAEPEKTNPPVETETKGEVGKIVDKLISWGFTKSSDRKIDTIILHSSYDALGDDPFSVSGIIAEYKQYNVSAHYLIARDGVIYRLVSDQNIAWHAGVAEMPDGRTNVNSFSIGVEMINTKDGKYTDAQYEAVNRLIGDLRKKYEIKNILGHNEIAPGRKTDPWNINWGKVQK